MRAPGSRRSSSPRETLSSTARPEGNRGLLGRRDAEGAEKSAEKSTETRTETSTETSKEKSKDLATDDFGGGMGWETWRECPQEWGHGSLKGYATGEGRP